MKTIKIFLTLFMALLSILVVSQDIEKSKKYEIDLSGGENQKLKLINLAGDIEIITSNSNKIIIVADGIQPIPKRAEGLKRVSAGGEDNTGIGLNMSKDGNDLILYGTVSMNSEIDYKISVPKNLKIHVELGIFNHGDIKITGLTSDLELDVKNSDIKLIDVTGPIVLSSLSGNTEALFSTVSQSGPISMKAISGEIDISLPANTPVDIELSSMSGGIYSDFDIKTEKKGELQHVGGSQIRTKLNNGGVRMIVSCISGNIYLRKKK